MSKEINVTFSVNGTQHECTVPIEEKLLDTLRRLEYKSVKFGCGEGTCGTCLVLVDGLPRFACITFTAQMEGREITTVEGLSKGEKLHPLQKAFIEEGAVQCGYCTPAMLLASKALLAEYPAPTEEQIRKGLDGNRCRCTGYVNIINAIQKAAQS